MAILLTLTLERAISSSKCFLWLGFRWLLSEGRFIANISCCLMKITGLLLYYYCLQQMGSPFHSSMFLVFLCRLDMKEELCVQRPVSHTLQTPPHPWWLILLPLLLLLFVLGRWPWCSICNNTDKQLLYILQFGCPVLLLCIRRMLLLKKLFSSEFGWLLLLCSIQLLKFFMSFLVFVICTICSRYTI